MESSKDKRHEKGLATRQKILAAALHLLGQKGSKRLSASSLAKQAGISKANVFHHFTDLEQIQIEALELLLVHMGEAISSKKHENLKTFMRDTGKASFEMMDEAPDMFRSFFYFYQRALHEKKYRDLFTTILGSYAKIFVLELKRMGYSKATLKNTQLEATLTGILLDGIGLHYLMFADRKKFEKIWNIFADMLAEKLEKTLKKQFSRGKR